MHRLILLRHAKAAWPEHVEDHQRPLAERGRDDAKVAAHLIATELPPVDAVICSPALRTRQTWTVASAELIPEPPVSLEPVLYGASADEVIEVVQMLPEIAGTVLIVGHEPTMSKTALALSGPLSNGPDLVRLDQKFPTCGIAVLAVSGLWSDVAPGSAALERFVVPRV